MSFAPATIIRSLLRDKPGLRSRLVAGTALPALVLPALALSATPAAAATIPVLRWLDFGTATGSAVIVGALSFATVLAIMYVRERQSWIETERGLRGELGDVRAARDRAELLLGTQGQVVIAWSGPGEVPTVKGDPAVASADSTLARVLAFGNWLASADAARLDAAVEHLRQRGEVFDLSLERLDGGFVEAEGRTVVGQAVLRIRDATDERAELLSGRADLKRKEAELASFKDLLGAIDAPVWLRDASGRLTWVNRAYADYLDAPSSGPVPGELLDAATRRDAARCREAGDPFRARIAAVAAGARRLLDVQEVPVRDGTGGIARDMSEIDQVRTSLDRRSSSQSRVLNRLPNALAIFDEHGHLLFFNAAYARLWHLDPAFLSGGPTEGEVLDQLRTARLLPEQADYRAWKADQLKRDGTGDGSETLWHLPDRRTVRVSRQPDGAGGVVCLFDDVSDRMHLESRFDALIRTQRDTLDALAEGVALFGSDGRLKLFNDAMVTLWRLDREQLDGSPHIDAVVALCVPIAPDEAPWSDLRAAVSGLVDRRERTTTRMERLDGSMLDCASEPLPDGATLLTFADVTATVNVERALTERNAALEAAGRIRDEFVHHVSYELRSPLTTVIGFAELLGAETVGPLNDRQRDYADHITRSSGALLAIINDILDLASIDTETITLARERVDVRRTIEAAALGIEDRMVEAELRLELDVPADIGSFLGDGKRVRQILYNLLSNAAGFSARGQAIRVSARREDGEIVIGVSDQGAGIPQHVRARVFDRFETHGAGLGHRGVGLGLSIVRSFVELHGGHVELVSELGSGTTVTCYFPADGAPLRQLAAEMPPGGPR